MLGWHDTPWMWLSMVVFWSLFAFFVYFAFMSPARSSRASDGPRATEILEARFARGEISVEEYEERRETLAAHATTRASERSG